MYLPKSSRELTGIFKDSSMPDLHELEGEYLVDMLTLWPSFKRYSHRKVLYREGDKVTGHNVLFGRVWGHFVIEECLCSDLDSNRAAVINYYRPENSFPVRRIRDYVRCVEKDIQYLGRFYYAFPYRMQFLGYFSLEKIQ